MKTFLLLIFLLPAAVPKIFAQDCWVSVEGAGQKNGQAAQDAYPASKAQRCWDETSSGGTLHVLEGNYSGKSFWRLKIYPHADPASYKTLRGEGKVRLTGPRPVPYSEAGRELGGTWLEIKKGTAGVRIENFHVAQVETGITAREGSNHALEFRDLNFEDTRQNVWIYGHPSCNSLKNCYMKAQLSSGVLIERVNGKRYSKRHIRLGYGLSAVKVIDSHADAEGIDGDFAVGFDAENPAWDIEFRDSSARGNIFSGSEYWNGDGFKSEEETSNIRWIGCSAFDNADAGFDIKSKDAVLEDITAERNTRNIRIWKSAILKNIQASNSKRSGGNSSEAGIWSQGPYECHSCTLKNNGIQVSAEEAGKPYRIQFYDSVLTLDSRSGEMVRLEDRVKAEWTRTVLSSPPQAA